MTLVIAYGIGWTSWEPPMLCRCGVVGNTEGECP